MKKSGRPKKPNKKLEQMRKQMQHLIQQRDQLNNGILHLDGEIKGYERALNENK